MVQLFKPPKNKTTKKNQQKKLVVTSLNHEGVGVARDNNKVAFIEGALTNETVLATLVQQKAKYERLITNKVLIKSPFRTTPFCTHFEQCGGCQLQHLQLPQQLIEKQQAVTQLFKKFAKIEQLNWQAPIESSSTNYRRSARIAVFYQQQQQKFLLGFRQQGAKKIINIEQCAVLEKRYSTVFTVFRTLLPQLKNGQAITHIQLYGVNHAFVIIRHISALPASDIELLMAACEQHSWKLVLEGETGDFHFIDNKEDSLPSYQLNQQQLTFAFTFANFIQVNDHVNQQMITQALDWLALSKNETVLDLFCGIGNFSLAMAQYAKQVNGVEGGQSSVNMATLNATNNAITNATFYCQDLTLTMSNALWYKQEYQVLVLDPSRTGALAILAQLPLKKFQRILYVSCDPVTLARDAELIINAGYKIEKIALMNMFPHTKHIETMALFTKS